MKINKKSMKTIGISLVMAAGMLLPTLLLAQNDNYQGGLLKPGRAKENHGLFGRGGLFDFGIEDEDFGSTPEGDIEVEDFGTPLGDGTLILLSAAAGYAALKTRNKKTNQQKRNEK